MHRRDAVMLIRPTKVKEMQEMNPTCFSRTLLLTIWLTSSCEHQSDAVRRLRSETVSATAETRPHHANELDELQAHGEDHRVLKVSDGADHLVVAGEELLHQTSLILRSPTHT